jgi:hypothetical protein
MLEEALAHPVMAYTSQPLAEMELPSITLRFGLLL